MAKLDGKVAIVTGAARGLGRAYAKRLAGLGAKVAVADLNLHSYETTYSNEGTISRKRLTSCSVRLEAPMTATKICAAPCFRSPARR